MRMLRHAGLVCCLVTFLAATGAAQSVPIDLGATIPNLYQIDALAVNESGYVVGRLWRTSRGSEHAYVWTPARGAFELAPGRWGWGVDVNTAGQVVGFVGGSAVECSLSSGCLGPPPPPPSGPNAFIWSARDGLVELGTLGGTRSRALIVNGAGEVFGVSEVSVGSDTLHAFVWTPAEGMQDLGLWPNCWTPSACNSASTVLTDINKRFEALFNTPNGPALWTAAGGLVPLGIDGNSAALNDKGDIVGVAATASGSQAFLWTPTDGMMNLGTLGGVSSQASNVNEDRWVVGWSTNLPTSSSFNHAFLWTPSGGMIDLGRLGETGSLALGVNERGQVVGRTVTLPSQIDGFVWTASDGMQLLPPLPGFTSSEALMVSNGGHVVGISRGSSGPPRATMWIVPVDGEDGWAFCAPENEVCAFTGTTEVRYGANGAFVVKTLTDGTACTNDVFGDPIFGTVKECATRNTPPATDWTFCATEGDTCAFTGTMAVRYGANGSFVFKTLTDGTACSNEVFGDPIVGTLKECSINGAPPPPEWTFCAPENAVCAFTGTREVRYGANDAFVIKTLTDGTACTNEVFGDPIFGVVKSCDLRSATGSPPQP